MNALCAEPFTNQRTLAEASGHSLGVVNRSVKNLQKEGYLDEDVRLTEKAHLEFQEKAPKNAIILAAGFGMRMVPISMEIPKGLLEVHGEPLIERTIRQLHEAGIREIYVVVGFMKEKYEYLIDGFDVTLIVNPEYAAKNNLHSLKRALRHLSNSYIIPCDIWCDQNPYRRRELYSWYMVSDLVDNDSSVRVNRKMELVSTPALTGGNAMVGISYLLEEQAAVVRKRIEAYSQDPRCDGYFWEEALYQDDKNQKDKMIVTARVVHTADVMEINTYEQLRELDGDSDHLKTDAIRVISQSLQTSEEEITHITVLKKGMTNRSFLFSCKGKKYIMRIPGEGTDRLIDRRQEALVYQTIREKGLCDEITYLDPENGYKITGFLEDARVCDPQDPDDTRRCMQRLRAFHEMRLTVGHDFDIFGQIEFYEHLWAGMPSAYRDYPRTKEQVFSLKPYIDAHAKDKVLTHMDAVPDNFLFVKNADGTEDILLIDWEYAGMQDPLVDVAMFCIYSLYDREQTDDLIDAYFPEGCRRQDRILIYCYIAACGLLWSNWCEYKRTLGVEFGEYSLRQYRYAKDYYKIVRSGSKKTEE